MQILPIPPALPSAALVGVSTCAAPVAATGNAAPSTTPFTGGRRNEYALGDVARALAMRHLAPRTIIDHLRALACDCEMPLPKNPRLYCGKIVHGAQSIHKHSRWDAELFDAWLDDRLPEPAPTITAAADRQLRAAMANRARLVVIQGGKP